MELGPEQYHNAYSIMLQGRASDFYFDSLDEKEYNFEQMIFETRCHFETEENKQLYLEEWRETTFARVIAATLMFPKLTVCRSS